MEYSENILWVNVMWPDLLQRCVLTVSHLRQIKDKIQSEVKLNQRAYIFQ